MSHQKGAYLGGIRSVEDVRGRCVMGDGGCWHLRSSRGKAMSRDRVHRIWVHGVGNVSAVRAVWELDRGLKMPRGRIGVRVCESYDCANPEHIKALTHSEAQRRLVGSGPELSLPRRLQLISLQRRRRRLTDEQVAEVLHSPERDSVLARKFSVSESVVRNVRRGVTYRPAFEALRAA